MSKENQKPGPDPERLKLPGDWKDQLADAVRKKRPKAGWPKPERKKRPKKG